MCSAEVYHPGNAEGDGFGHIAFNCDDVYASCERLEKSGVGFKKKPDEGRMKGLAFALDPDGYWVEVVQRSEQSRIGAEFNLSQTMLRVCNPAASLAFCRDGMGMTLVRESHYPEANFSLYFLASLPQGERVDYDPADRAASGWLLQLEGVAALRQRLTERAQQLSAVLCALIRGEQAGHALLRQRVLT